MTAVEWLAHEINKINVSTLERFFIEKLINHAKELEKQQHGHTWDSAIKAHDDRGHVHARSLVDFDEYYNETYKTQAT